MQDEIRQIAARMKELREIAGLDEERMAGELGIGVEEYRGYESGGADIPVSLLYRVAGRFNVELSALLGGGNPRLHVYSVVRKGRGLGVERRSDYKYQSLACNFVHKKAEPFLVTVDPVPEGEPYHFNSHPGQEFNYVLEGSMRVSVGGHEILLEEGDALYFDSGFEHGMKAAGGRPARFLAVIL